MRDKLLRAFGIFTGYEAINWFGLRPLVPASQAVLAFLVLTAVGLATLLIYLVWLAPYRAKPRVRYPSAPNLPLYLVIGRSDSGKSAIVRNFWKDPALDESSEQAPFKLYCSNKSANSALTEDFVVADVDGKVFEGDPGAWDSILKHLSGTGWRKSLRALLSGQSQARSELRGVVLVCSLRDLAYHLFLPSDVAKHILSFAPKQDALPDPGSYTQLLAERLKAVREIFCAQFPVHVIFTHLDGVQYAPSFLAKFDGPESEMPFGTVLDISATDRSMDLGNALGQVLQAIAQYRVPVLYKTEDLGDKPPVYQYPRELMKLRPGVTSFLTQVFQRFSSSAPRPILRSVHLTGMKQPIGSKADPQKTFFIADFWQGGKIRDPNEVLFAGKLFSDRILPDQFRAHNGVLGSRRQISKIAFAILATICLVAVSRSWMSNRDLVGQVADVTRFNQSAFAASTNSITSRQLEGLERLRKTIQTLTNDDQNHPGMGWGLYQGSALLPNIRELYFREFRRALLDPLRDVFRYRFEHLGSAGLQTSFETVKDDVRAYQMTHGRACQVDANFLANHLQTLWLNHMPAMADSSALAFAQFRFYATELKRQDPYSLQPDQQLVTRAQSYLQSFRSLDDVYAAIIGEANGTLKPAQLIDVLEDSNERVELSRNYAQAMEGADKIEPAFSRANAAWVRQRIANRKQAGAGDPCIFGRPDSGAGNGSGGEQELQQKYETNFAAAWKDLLKNSHVRAFSPSDGATRLDVLAQNRSPLLALFAFVSANTSQEQAPPGASAPSPPTKAAALGLFRPVWLVVPPGKPMWKGDATDGYIQALRALRDALQNYKDKPSADGSAADDVRTDYRTGVNTVDRLRDSFGNGTEGVDHEVERLLKEPFLIAMKIMPVPKAPGAEADQALKEFCAQWRPLLIKFPFNPQSNDDVSLDELKSVFQPNSGKLWDFLSKGIVAKSASGAWVAGLSAKSLLLDKRFLDFFRRMAAVSDQLFHDGAAGFNYTIQVAPNPQVKDITFNVNGQDGGSSPTEKHFRWPGSNPSDFRLQARGATFRYAGLWSVYRMVQAADAHTATGVEISKIQALHGLESPLIGEDGKPTKVELTLPDLPLGIGTESIFSRLECPPRAIQHQ